MDRYVAMAWDISVAGQAAQVGAWTDNLLSNDWTMALEAPGFVLLCRKRWDGLAAVTPMDPLCGAVAGTLFRAGCEQAGRVNALTDSDVRGMHARGGGHLIKTFWGKYVAFWREPGASGITILRDPAGGAPCFMTHARGIDIVFAYVPDIVRLEGLAFSIDWDFLKGFLLFGYCTTPRTGLREIVELLPGQRVVCVPGQPRRYEWAWNAVEIAAAPARRTFEETCDELRSIGETCLGAWASDYRKVMVQLSGGLDSAIVLGLMRGSSNADLTALHFVGRDYEAYELALARLAAVHAGVRLIEAPPASSATDLSGMLRDPPLARPTLEVLGQRADAAAWRACEHAGANVLVAGHGGDSLFLQRSVTGAALEDYVRLNGFGRGFWTIAYDMAVAQQRPVWHLLGGAISAPVRNHAWSPYAFIGDVIGAGQTALLPEAAESVDPALLVHPWLSQAAKLPTGKAEQLQAIVSLYRYMATRGHAVVRDALNPFVSQPVLEFALRTPTYLFACGGRDRALEREAFADLIPDAIARRSGKGFIDHHLLRLARGNLSLFRMLVLEGELQERQWFDRPRIEAMLTPEYLADGASAGVLYQLVAVEAWLAAWRALPRR